MALLVRFTRRSLACLLTCLLTRTSDLHSYSTYVRTCLLTSSSFRAPEIAFRRKLMRCLSADIRSPPPSAGADCGSDMVARRCLAGAASPSETCEPGQIKSSLSHVKSSQVKPQVKSSLMSSQASNQVKPWSSQVKPQVTSSQVKPQSRQVKSSQVKSSQVKSSQVKPQVKAQSRQV